MARLLLLYLLLLNATMQAQSVLTPVKSFQWKGYRMQGAINAGNDSTFITCSNGSITSKNVFTGNVKSLLNSSDSIADFNIHWARNLLVYNDARRVYHVYNIKLKREQGRFNLPDNIVNPGYSFSPTGQKLMLFDRFVPALFSQNSKEAEGSILLFTTSLDKTATIKVPGNITDAVFFNEDIIIVSTMAHYRSIVVACHLSSGKLDEIYSTQFQPICIKTNSVDNRVILSAGSYLHSKVIEVVEWKDSHWNILSELSLPYETWNAALVAPRIKQPYYLICVAPGRYNLLENDKKYSSTEFAVTDSVVPAHRISFSERGRYFVVTNDSGKTTLYKFPAFERQMQKKEIGGITILNQRLKNDGIDDAQFAPSRNVLAIRDEQRNINFYDLNRRRKFSEFKEESTIKRFKLHPRDPVIIYGGNLVLKRYNYENGIKETFYNYFLNDFDFSQDGNKLVVAEFKDPYVRVLDYHTLETRRLVKIPLAENETIYQIRFDPSGEALIATSSIPFGQSQLNPVGTDFQYRLYYARKNDSTFKMIDVKPFFNHYAFSPDGKALVYSGSQDSTFYLYRLPTDTDSLRITRVPFYYCDDNYDGFRGILYVSSFYFENDSLLRVMRAEKTICTYNIHTNEWLEPLAFNKAISDIKYEPGTNYIFRINTDSTIDIASKYDHTQIMNISSIYPDLYKAFFTRDNKLVIVTRSFVKVFNPDQLKTDTVVPIQYLSRFSKIQMDSLAGTLLYGDYPTISTLSISKPIQPRIGDFETKYEPGVGLASFIADQQRGLLYRLITGLTGKHDITLRIENANSPDKELLFRYDFPNCDFVRSGMTYCHKDSTVYIYYKDYFKDKFFLISVRLPDGILRQREIVAFSVGGISIDEPNRNIYIVTYGAQGDRVEVLDQTTLETKNIIRAETDALSLAFDHFNNRLVIGGSNGYLRTYNLKTQQFIRAIPSHEGSILSLAVSGYNKLASVGSEGSLKYWNLRTMSLIGTLYTISPDDFLFINDKGYYYTTKNGIKALEFRAGKSMISPEQLDSYFNRPDLVLQRLDKKANTRMIELYKLALKKRNGGKKLLSPADFRINELPVVLLKNSNVVSLETDSAQLGLQLQLIDPRRLLKNYQVWVNNVPVFPGHGKSLSARDTVIYQSITLSEGDNKIEISITNEANLESARFKRWITFRPKEKDKYKPKLYLFTVAVNNYSDPAYNLKYAVNDGRRLIDLLSSGYAKNRIVTDSFFNQNAVNGVLYEIKKRLINTNVNDKVIIHFSGHGTVDTSALEFYFGTHDIDFNKPAPKGISYSQIEELLENIPARRKLILIDACHSGLSDKLAIRTQPISPDTIRLNGETVVLKNAGRIGKSATNTEKQSFSLMQDAFWNLSKKNGTFIITASAGDSYALESANFENGIFTFFLAEALSMTPSNGTLAKSVREIGEYVSKKVYEVTKGRQKPEIRTDYLDFDWTIFE